MGQMSYTDELGSGSEQLPFLDNGTRKLIGTSYVVTKFATTPESLLVYYTITDKFASARISLLLLPGTIPCYRFPRGTRCVVNLN
jgi:hypothetical protein